MSGGPGTSDPLHVAYRQVTLKQLIAQAYAVDKFQISGPDWLDTRHYDIDAKVPAGAPPEQLQGMLQNLLADRFQVRLHPEKKPVLVCDLFVAKGGLRMKAAAKGNHIEMAPMIRGIHVGGSGSIADFTRALEKQLGVPVEDKTGVTGIYKFDFGFYSNHDTILTETTRQVRDDPSAFRPPLLESALAELGLTLKQESRPLNVLFVEHAEINPR